MRSFCILFYILAVYKLLNGMWMFQLRPHLFLTRFDGFTWLFMQTGFHRWLIDNPTGWLLADIFFYSLPLLYFVGYTSFNRFAGIIAFAMLLVNWVYVQCYTLYPTNSIEAHTAWLLFPLLFMTGDAKTFRLVAEGLRYFFLYLFFSAGIWKIVNGAVFYTDQMSGVLLYQHADLLENAPHYWQASMFKWLIAHPVTGYCLYIGATLIELLFGIGFFTKKYDRMLIIACIVFLVFDLLLMRIPYFEVLPFLLLLSPRIMHRDLPSYAAVPRNRNRS